MRGAARLGIAEPDMTTVVEAGAEMPCVICGEPTHYFGRRKRGIGGVWDATFTDRDRVLTPAGGELGRAVCPWCATAVALWRVQYSSRSSDYLSPAFQAPSHLPYLIADGMTRVVAPGIAGLRELAALERRSAPFVVLGGEWQHMAYHWVWAPVSYPYRRWLALWVVKGRPRVIWVDGLALSAVADELSGAGAEDTEAGVALPGTTTGGLQTLLAKSPAIEAARDGSGQYELIKTVLAAKPLGPPQATSAPVKEVVG